MATLIDRRLCKEVGCGAVLSAYNESAWCSIHERRHRPGDDERRISYAGKRMSPTAAERQRTASRVRNQALRRLVELHRAEFDRLLAEQWAEEGGLRR